jgi:hypothetical protein
VGAARNGAALGSLVAGLASVGAMPLAVYLTGFFAAYELKDTWIGIPVAAVLGILAIALARRARFRSAVLLGRGGGTGLARTGRVLGIVGICMACTGGVAFAVFGLLEYAGTRN